MASAMVSTPLRRGFCFSMPYANLATAGEEAHNANAVRTAKKNESCGEAAPWEADQPDSAPGPAASGAFLFRLITLSYPHGPRP